MSNNINYFKLIKDITNKASDTYFKYQEYNIQPEKFKEKEPSLFFIFQTADNLLKINKDYSEEKANHNHHSNNDSCYEIIESNPKDTDEVIKNNYKRLIKEYHPDAIAGKNLPKGFMDFAHHRFKEIQNAYETIKKERGFK